MSAAEVIDWLECAGAALVVRGDGRALVTKRGAPVPDATVRAAIVEHADAIDSHFAAARSSTCPECEAGIHAEAADVFECCKSVFCPSWKAGAGPEWFARARSYALWRREQDRAEVKRLEETRIPE